MSTSSNVRKVLITRAIQIIWKIELNYTMMGKGQNTQEAEDLLN